MTQPVNPFPQPVATRNGFGVTALVLGIIGVCLAWIPIIGFVGFILGALAVIFGGLAAFAVHKGTATNRLVSYFGLGLGIASVALSSVVWLATVQEIDKSVNEWNQTTPYSYTPPSTNSGNSAPVTATKQVVFEAWGDGTLSVNYSAGGTYNTEEVTGPWSVTLTDDDTYSSQSLTTTRTPSFEEYQSGANSGEIGCRITVDGVVVDEKTATGQFGYAMCDSY